MSCCSPDNSCSTGTATATADPQTAATVYGVSGMTCGHCKATVSKAIGDLPGVSGVEVDLTTGQVTVTTEGTGPEEDLIAKAVDEAGYEFTGRA